MAIGRSSDTSWWVSRAASAGLVLSYVFGSARVVCALLVDRVCDVFAHTTLVISLTCLHLQACAVIAALLGALAARLVLETGGSTHTALQAALLRRLPPPPLSDVSAFAGTRRFRHRPGAVGARQFVVGRKLILRR